MKNPPTPILNPSIEYALQKATLTGQTLPPGELVQLEQFEWNNRHYLLDQSQRYGSIFKILTGDKLCICIVGLQECTEFINAHSKHITPQTISLESLFPKGFIRQMSGEVHQKYRKALTQSIASSLSSISLGNMQTIITEQLARYAQSQTTDRNPRASFINTLNAITSGILIQRFFGIRYGTDLYKEILSRYTQMGPNGVVWEISRQQQQAYTDICKLLLTNLEKLSSQNDHRESLGILGAISEQGDLDESFIGNLIYMVELGRYDMYSLFRWLAKFAVDNPAFIERIASEDQRSSKLKNSLADAFVMETLRLEQSERLMRCINRDLTFRNYLFPENSLVRLCLWESHKSPDVFDNPFEFKPDRFMNKGFTRKQYAPFGIGEHHCPFSNFSVKMSNAFLTTLVENYTLEPIANDPPVRGIYHWEPAWNFAIKLQPK